MTRRKLSEPESRELEACMAKLAELNQGEAEFLQSVREIGDAMLAYGVV